MEHIVKNKKLNALLGHLILVGTEHKVIIFCSKWLFLCCLHIHLIISIEGKTNRRSWYQVIYGEFHRIIQERQQATEESELLKQRQAGREQMEISGS